MKSPITTPKPEQATKLSKDLDKIVAEPMEELDIEALLTKLIGFIRQNEYLENLLDDLLNNDDPLDEFQDDPATTATVGIIPLQFVDQDANSYYLEQDVTVEEAKCVALVPTKLEEIKF